MNFKNLWNKDNGIMFVGNIWIVFIRFYSSGLTIFGKLGNPFLLDFILCYNINGFDLREITVL